AFTLALPPLWAQGDWPRSFQSGGEQIKVYPWQPESLEAGTLAASAAIAVQDQSGGEPAFGMIWIHAQTTQRGDRILVQSLEVTDIRLPTETDPAALDELRRTIG